MKELREKRSLTAKHFDNGDGTFTVQAHSGHIHYFDKLGGTGVRGIDWTLNFDEVKRGWSFKFHSFRPFIPEFADQWVVFRDLFQDKDQSVKYRAHSSHTKGRLVMPSEIGMEKQTGQNCVIYDNAFGEGLDYIIYFTRSTMKKVVRIREGYKTDTDMHFTWDVAFPTGEKVFRAEKKEKIGTTEAYELDITKGKSFDTKKSTLIGTNKKDGKEWYTYLRDFKCWDSGEMETYHTQNIVVDFDAKAKTLTKIIPATFLKESTGDVFSDTTTSYYAGAGDGFVAYYSASSNWDNVHNATDGTSFSYTGSGDGYIVSDIFSASQLQIYRSFLPIDTSALPDDCVISDANLYFYITSTSNPLNIGLVQTTQASNTALSNADYDTCGSTHSATEGATRLSSYTTSAYNYFTLNSTGIGWISKTGYTKLGIRSSADLDDSQPSTAEHRVFYNTSEATGTSTDPYLSVTYTTGSSVNSGFFALM